MNLKVAAICVLACVAAFAFPRAASAALDLVPAPGAAPIHVRVTATVAGADGPRTIDADVIVRRTGPASAVIQQNADITPVDVAPDGTLHARAPAGMSATGDLVDVLSVLNVAHDVTGAAGAGSRDGWTAAIPLPAAPAPAGTSPVPLLVPIHALAANGPADFDIDGTAETTIEAPAGQRRQRSRQGGFNGGFGGFGGRGGFGGGGPGGGGPGGGGPADGEPGGGAADGAGAGEPPRARNPITLDLHVTGHVAHSALARMTVVATRRIVIGGLTYTNVGTSTIDVVR